MSTYKSTLIRYIASCIFFLRSKSLSSEEVKFVVCTGSVGKTIMRRSLALSLDQNCSGTYFTLQTDYCNEMGVLLSLLRIESFSFLSPLSWVELFFKKPDKNGYILIELGADFRLDIDWFLKRWSPYTVILTQATTCPWTQVIDKVLYSRVRLCTSGCPGSVFVSHYDAIHISLLKENSVNFITIEHSPDIYSYPASVLLHWCKRESIEPPTFIPFTKNRFTYQKNDTSTLIKDIYKVTPECLTFFLNKILSEKTQKKIILISEIRPLLAPYENVYRDLLQKLQLIDEVYFVGDYSVYTYLAKECSNITSVTQSDILRVIQKFQKVLNKESVTIGVKISSHYSHQAIDTLNIIFDDTGYLSENSRE